MERFRSDTPSRKDRNAPSLPHGIASKNRFPFQFQINFLQAQIFDTVMYDSFIIACAFTDQPCSRVRCGRMTASGNGRLP